MRVLLQRVSHASVTVEGQVVGHIERGLLVLLGIAPSDGERQVQMLVDKIVQLRIFADAEGKMNLSLLDIMGEVLVVSQFTLYANMSKGRRPSFVGAAPPTLAEPLYEVFKHSLTRYNLSVASGTFGADMKVDLRNDGPVTLWLDSEMM